MPIATPQGTLDFKSVDKVTFVGASSNTVIDTTTGSLGVGVGVGGPTSNLHVVGNTRLEGDINMLHTSNTASIKLNSNVVAEFPRSKKLIKYPRVALTSAAATSPGYQEYIATASSFYNNALQYDAWAAFNGNVEEATQEGWLSISGSYNNATPSLPVTSGSNAELFNSRYGDWLNIKLPHKIVLSKLHTYPRTGNENPGVVRDYEHPDAGYLYGSNDGFSTFQEIYSFDGVPVSTTFRVPTIHTVNATKAYNEYRFQVTKLKGQRAFTAISEMELYGVPEYDPEAHGVDVTIKSVPNVPNTDWLEVYYEGKNYTNGNSVQDETDNNIDGSFTGITHNTEYNSFDFNGVSSSSKITATLPSTFVGNQPFTVSVWFKRYNDLVTENTIWRIGPRTDEKCLGLAVSNGNFNFFGNDSTDGSFTSKTYPGGGGYVVDRWYHVACVYDGSSRYIFIDSVRDGTTVTNSLNFNASTELVLGFNGVDKYLNGSIANFRLFNRVLTSDEIYQLYTYQKEYFGHGNLSMTLKAGRLGIGTSEPKATLDVRGDMILNGIPFGNMRPSFFTTGPYGGAAVGRTTTDISNGTNTRIVVPYEKDYWGGRQEYDPTNSFDNTTHTYTVPKAGLWYFSVSGMVRSLSSGNHYAVLYITVNDSEKTRSFVRLAPDNIEIQSFQQYVTYCNAGDKIQVVAFLLQNNANIDIYVNHVYGTFFGFMLP